MLRIDHPVRLQLQRPAQVLLRRRDRLVVVGAVEPRRAIGARAVLRQLLRDVRLLRRPFENEVLEQMRHPRLAVVLMPRPDFVGDIHRHDRARRIGEKQHAQPIRQGCIR